VVKRNPHIAALPSQYLFVEVARRKAAFCEKNPDTPLIDLGIGDFVDPLSQTVAEAMSKTASSLATKEGFSGYGPTAGNQLLRERIANVLYQDKINANEIHISDGAKPDMGRLQLLFGSKVSVAVQEPVYPAYVDTSYLLGQKELVLMPNCTNFFPNLSETPRTDIIFFCSPNNPTGTAATFEQLEELVAFAKKNRSIIIFDTAYSAYIRDPNIPKSIYEIPGGREIAIEVGSFSKMAGFTGVRLGWSVTPKELKFEDGTTVADDWQALYSRFFNGASIVAQAGGLAALTPKGLNESKLLADQYLENAREIKEILTAQGHSCFGGQNCPYVWAQFEGLSSWEAFDQVLNNAHTVTVPGSGFGKSGEGFLRFSGFSKNVLSCC